MLRSKNSENRSAFGEVTEGGIYLMTRGSAVARDRKNALYLSKSFSTAAQMYEEMHPKRLEIGKWPLNVKFVGNGIIRCHFIIGLCYSCVNIV